MRVDGLEKRGSCSIVTFQVETFTWQLCLEPVVVIMVVVYTSNHLNHTAVFALLAAVKKRPTIRFLSSSEVCKQLAYKVSEKLKSEATVFAPSVCSLCLCAYGWVCFFIFVAFQYSCTQQTHKQQFSSPPSLLIVWDRREDPVTPLLFQWTYQVSFCFAWLWFAVVCFICLNLGDGARAARDYRKLCWFEESRAGSQSWHCGVSSFRVFGVFLFVRWVGLLELCFVCVFDVTAVVCLIVVLLYSKLSCLPPRTGGTSGTFTLTYEQTRNEKQTKQPNEMHKLFFSDTCTKTGVTCRPQSKSSWTSINENSKSTNNSLALVCSFSLLFVVFLSSKVFVLNRGHAKVRGQLSGVQSAGWCVVCVVLCSFVCVGTVSKHIGVTTEMHRISTQHTTTQNKPNNTHNSRTTQIIRCIKSGTRVGMRDKHKFQREHCCMFLLRVWFWLFVLLILLNKHNNRRFWDSWTNTMSTSMTNSDLCCCILWGICLSVCLFLLFVVVWLCVDTKTKQKMCHDSQRFSNRRQIQMESENYAEYVIHTQPTQCWHTHRQQKQWWDIAARQNEAVRTHSQTWTTKLHPTNTKQTQTHRGCWFVWSEHNNRKTFRAHTNSSQSMFLICLFCLFDVCF